MPFTFDTTITRLGVPVGEPAWPTPVGAPEVVALNEALAGELGLDVAELRAPAGVGVLAGVTPPRGEQPVALAYAGHQFGGFVPRLGDGRALLLGEVVGADGARRDVQLKGSGRTPFSRGGDGRAALGPVLREYLLGEAMAALGVPTTRALAAVRTGEVVRRERALPGAVLTRVASSHLRIGTLQYHAARGDEATLRALVEYALGRHFPERRAEGPLGLFDAVFDAQLRLVARWMSVGFVHGVMNTDNTSLSGETLDYGPAAFLDAFDPARTFSSIDHHGRYSYGNQPRALLWNLARLGEALLPLLGPDEESAVRALEGRLEAFAPRFEAAEGAEFARKLGLAREPGEEEALLARRVLALFAAERADFTQSFVRLTESVASADPSPFAEPFAAADLARELAREVERAQAREGVPREQAAARMRRANPRFVPRNHRVEEALAAAESRDLRPFERLLRVVAAPFEEHAGDAELAAPPGDEQWEYRTFCGT